MTVDYQDKDFVIRVALNRPEVRNAFNEGMIAELTEAFNKAALNQTARVMIIKGEGKSFCAGADLHWMKSMANFTKDENIKDSEKLYEMFVAMEKIPFPIVGQIHGHAMGGALGLVALCDIVAAERETQFCFSEARLGLAPAVISSFIIKKIPRSQVHRFFLSAETFTVEQAKKMGFVHFSGSSDDVEEFILSTSQRICKNGPQALRRTKILLQEIYESRNPKKSIELIADLRVSKEGQEGLKAFFEKRKPQWVDQK